MSTSNGMPPPTTKGRSPKKRPAEDLVPDPNANRAEDYPNTWRIERGKQTAKCNFCSHRLAGTKWCVLCDKCSRRMCSPCWEGTRVNRYDEAIFEGRVQNEEGCWCRFRTKFDPKWKAESDARAARMEKLISAGMRGSDAQATVVVDSEATMVDSEEDTEIEEPVTKRQRTGLLPSRTLAPVRNYRHTQPAQDFEEESDLRSAAYQESRAVESPQQLTPEASPVRPRRIKHLDKKTTIIIGAGVIGLAIARELAAVTRNTETEHTVIVVEKNVSFAEEASRHCAGIIAKHGVTKEYKQLLDLSLQSWHDLLNSDHGKICKDLRYLPRGVMHVKPKSTEQEESNESPTWYNLRPQDALKAYNSDIGKISTSKFVKYLYQECRELGVQFRFRQEVDNIDRMKSGKLMSADVAKVGDPNRFISISCNNLIFATGSHTPDALHEILPWMEPRTTLVNNKQHCDWVRISAPTLRNADKVGLVIRDSSGGDSTIMAAQPGQEILVASVRPENKRSPFNDSGIGQKHLADTTAQARSQLRDTEVSNDLTSGHTIISTALENLPLVCKIPSKLIDDRFTGEDKTPMGIYLAYGFGMYGTTMSLGVAAALRSMIMGHDARIGEAFSYP